MPSRHKIATIAILCLLGLGVVMVADKYVFPYSNIAFGPSYGPHCSPPGDCPYRELPDGKKCRSTFPIKAAITLRGQRYRVLPDDPNYIQTTPEWCFSDLTIAQNAGYR